MTPLLGASFLALLLSQAVPAPESRARDAAEAVHPRPLPLPFPPNTDARLPLKNRRGAPKSRRDAHEGRGPSIPPSCGRCPRNPPIEALRAAATALVLAEPGRARSLVDRARFAGWLPELRIMVDRRFARTESVDLGTSTDVAALAPVGIDSNNDVRYQARATWDLSKLIFNSRDDRGAVPRPCAPPTRAGRSNCWSSVSTSSAGASRPSQRTADDLDMLPGSRRELRIAEIEAELDALTGGVFTRLARHRPIEGESRPEP